MFMNTLKTGKIVLAVLLFSLPTLPVLAQQSEPLLNFKFNHLSNKQNIEELPLFEAPLKSKSDDLNFSQLDATWTYPWESKNINIDLGFTLRHLSGYTAAFEADGSQQHFQKVLPLFHASALFSLPLEGLSAGIEGSHLDYNNSQVLDYRAKVSYEWRKGFGLQGGWQHQQFNLDDVTGSGAGFEKNGPFLDFYLNF